METLIELLLVGELLLCARVEREGKRIVVMLLQCGSPSSITAKLSENDATIMRLVMICVVELLKIHLLEKLHEVVFSVMIQV